MAPAPSVILDSKVTQGQEAPTPGLNILSLISQPGPPSGLPYTTHLPLFLSSGEDEALVRAGMALAELIQLPASPAAASSVLLGAGSLRPCVQASALPLTQG